MARATPHEEEAAPGPASSGTRLGEVEVPASALWGAQTARAVENFPISGLREPRSLVDAMVRMKLAAARVNARLGLLPRRKARAIEAACREVLSGRWDDQFVVDAYQAGAGTSFHMNVNEVLANRASELLGGRRGDRAIDPNDDVNMAQSTNDVIPTAMRLAALATAPAHGGGARGAGRHLRAEGPRLGRHREVGAHPPHGRDAHPAGAGGLGLGGRPARGGGARERRPAGAGGARHRGNGGGHRA